MTEEISNSVVTMDAEIQIKFIIHNVCTKEDLKGEDKGFFRAIVKDLLEDDKFLFGVVEDEYEIVSINACNVKREKVVRQKEGIMEEMWKVAYQEFENQLTKNEYVEQELVFRTAFEKGWDTCKQHIKKEVTNLQIKHEKSAVAMSEVLEIV